VRARRDRLGQTSAAVQGNHLPLRLAQLEPALRAQVAAEPDQTLRELCQWARDVHGIRVGTTTMHKTLARLKLPLKKTLRAAEQARTDVAQAREEWAAGQPSLPASRLIFLDETSATTIFVCALSTEGRRAPLVLDGPLNGEVFRVWVGWSAFLCPSCGPATSW
jgi:hypothetical protein